MKRGFCRVIPATVFVLGMSMKKKLRSDNPEQSAKFIELAKEHPVSKEEFEGLFKKITAVKPQKPKPKDKTKEVQTKGD